MNRSYVRLVGALAALGAFVAARGASASAVVVPKVYDVYEGNSNNYFPLGETRVDMRYQQVYAASAFPTGGGPLAIYALVLRADGVGGQAFSLSFDHVEINLSTTAAAPDALSLTFADNVGPNETTVYDDALVISSAAAGPFGGPLAFDAVVNFETPFVYDPTAGNLLLDVRSFPSALGSSIFIFDAHDEAGDAVSRVWNSPVTATTGNLGDPYPSLGLVTKFVYVPEPSAAAFALPALVAALRRRARRAALSGRRQGEAKGERRPQRSSLITRRWCGASCWRSPSRSLG